MRVWKTATYDFSAPISGRRWLVFAKSKGDWIPIGGQMSEADARAEVERIRSQGRLFEPHCVPA